MSKERPDQSSLLICASVQLVAKGLFVSATQASSSLISVTGNTALSGESLGGYFLNHLWFIVHLENVLVNNYLNSIQIFFAV